MGTVIDALSIMKNQNPGWPVFTSYIPTTKRFSVNDDSSELMKINKAAGLCSRRFTQSFWNPIVLGNGIAANLKQPYCHQTLIQILCIGFSDAKLLLAWRNSPLLQINNPNAIVLSEGNQSCSLKEKGWKLIWSGARKTNQDSA